MFKVYVNLNPFSPPLETISIASCEFVGGPVKPLPFKVSSVCTFMIIGPGYAAKNEKSL